MHGDIGFTGHPLSVCLVDKHLKVINTSENVFWRVVFFPRIYAICCMLEDYVMLSSVAYEVNTNTVGE